MRKIEIYFNYLTFLLSTIVPKHKNRWVFGAWFGSRVSDNPYAFYKYMQDKYPELELIWVCNDVSEAQSLGIKAVKKGTLKASWICLTANVSIMNQGYFDFGKYNWVQGSYKVQLWHGVPWKRIGEDTVDEIKGLFHRLNHHAYLFANRCDLYIAPSEETKQVIKTAFLTDDKKILSVGQPRNEILFDINRCLCKRNKIKETIADANKIILYMPTFRDKSTETFSFLQIQDMVIPLLEKYDAVILEKQHYVQLQRDGEKTVANERIFNVENYDTQDLLAAADILITDYSSCFFDFLLRNKPILHFLYDYENYRNKDRGLYYDADYVTAGNIVVTQEELLVEINELLKGQDDGYKRRELIRNRFDTYESTENSKRIAEEIFMHINK